MSTKNTAYDYIRKPSYTMDGRDFLLVESLIDKEIVILQKEGIEFYFSYESIDKTAVIVAIEPNEIAPRLEKYRASVKRMATTFGNQDFRLYGMLTENGMPNFYDLKINDNYLIWEDFCIELNVFELPNTIPLWRGIVKDTAEIRKEITKRAGKEEKDFFFRPVIESVEVTYSGGDRKKNKVQTEEQKQKTTTEISTRSTTNTEHTNDISDEMLENFARRNSSPFECDLSCETEDLYEEIPDIKDLEPYLTSTIVSEDGEIDESAVNEYTTYYGRTSHLKEVITCLEEDGIELNVPNRSLIIDQINKFITDKMVEEAFLICIKYIRQDKNSFAEVIRKEIASKCCEIADKLINEARQKEMAMIDVDTDLVLVDLRSLYQELDNINAIANECDNKNIWAEKDIMTISVSFMAEAIADDLYSIYSGNLFGDQVIRKIGEIIKKSKDIDYLVKKVKYQLNIIQRSQSGI